MKKPTTREMKEAVRIILRGIGEDPEREGLQDTPRRFISALEEVTLGSKVNEEKVLKTLFDAEGYDDMIVLDGIPFQSTCEHHLLPFVGKADVGYIPGPSGRIFGISKLARVVELYAKRLQNQERITKQVAEALMRAGDLKGVAVVLQASHMCMVCRGIRKPGSRMSTSKMEGAFRYNASARSEFFELCKRRGREG